MGLSGKLLVLTILFVMIAEVLIYVPSIANYRLSLLNDRLSAAYTRSAGVPGGARRGGAGERGAPGSRLDRRARSVAR